MTSIRDNHIIVDNKDLHVAMLHAIMAAELTSDYDAVTWEEVKKEDVKDDICMSLCNAIENGFPENKSQAPECMRKFYKLKDELYSMDGVPFLGERMYIPATLRRRVLTILHAAHQGVSGMKASHNRVWWIGMDAAIDQTRAQCKECNGMSPSNIREPLVESPEPQYPWQLAIMAISTYQGYIIW